MTASEAPAIEASSGPAPVRRVGQWPLIFGLGGVLLAAMVLSLGLGEVEISPAGVIGILADHAGIETGLDFTQRQDAVLWSIRLPRVLLGVVVGSGLGVAGAALQGIFRNPLADPQLIGVSSGAALGSASLIAVAGGSLGLMAGPIGGFVGGIVAGGAVYSIARYQGRTEVVTLILAGIAVAAIGGAGAGMVSFIVDDPAIRTALFWSLGSLSVATWKLWWVTVPFVAAGVFLLPFYARALNLTLLGEREALHLGVDVERVRFVVLGLAVLTVGATVAAAGVIGFVGLLVPHGIRLAAGPDHRVVLPASAVGGAALVVLADLAARVMASPIDVPVGLLTAIVGGPLFLWLLRRTRREHGGWG